MNESQTDVKMEESSVEDVKAQEVNEDVKPNDVPYGRFKEI